MCIVMLSESNRVKLEVGVDGHPDHFSLKELNSLHVQQCWTGCMP